MPRWAWLVAGALLLSHAVLAWLTRTPGVTHSNDDALYALLGQQLGHFSYRETFRVGAPLHGQYPPAWPLLIAITNLLSGHREAALFLLVTLLSTAGFLLFFDVLRRILPLPLALGVLAGAVLNPYEVAYAGRLMSEAAYWFWTALTLWALVRTAGDRRYYLLAGVAAVVAAFTRSIGVTLIGAVVVTWALERRWRPAISLATISAILVGAWTLYTVRTHENVVGRSYMADAGHYVQQLTHSGSAPARAVKTLANRVREQVVGVVPAMMPLPRFQGTVIDNVVWLVAAVCFGIGGILALRRRMPVVLLYLAFYYGLLAVWPWAPRRFFIPIQPLVLLVLVAGALHLFRQRHERLGWAMAGLLLASVLAVAVPQSLGGVRELRGCDRSNPWVSPRCYGPDERSFFAAVVFARDSLPTDARFLVEREASFAYHTHRVVQHAQVPMGLEDDEFLRYLADNRIDYIVLTHLINVELQGMAPKLQAVCDRLELVRQFPPYGRLYRTLPAPAPLDRNACVDLDSYLVNTPVRPTPR